MAEPTIGSLRKQIAAELRAEEERRATADTGPTGSADPADIGAALRARDAPGPTQPSGLPPGLKVVGSEQALDPALDPAKIFPGAPQPVGNYRTPAEATPGSQIQGAQSPHNAGGRALLDLVSGGATEEALAAEAEAAERAKKDVTGKDLSGYSPEQLAELDRQRRYSPQQQGSGPQRFVRVAPQWQPGQRTAQTGSTGVDPADRDAIFTLEKGRGINDEEAMLQSQDAEGNKHRMMLEVQNNALQAEEAFRRDQNSIQQRYDTERADQMEKLKQIQTAMDEVGKQPRTIREWLDRSGTGAKVTYGLAAALSALGGAMGRRGNQPLQDLFNRTQASIDSKVKQEQDAYRILGDKAKLSDSIYARIRTATQDDAAALNITKAMYYDALGHMVDQVGTQYKLDMQSPQVLDFMSKLSGRYQDLIKETASKLQVQQSQTDRFNPGGVFAVGGGAKAPEDKGPGAGEKYFNELKHEYGKERESRKINVNEDTIEHLDNFDKVIDGLGVKERDELWGVMAQVATLKDPKLAAGLVMALPERQAKAAALLIQGVEKRRHALSGANYTAGEGIADLFKLGGATRGGIRSYRNELAAEKDASIAALGAGYPGGIPEAYESDRVLRRRTGPMVTPGGRSLNPSDMTDRKVLEQPKVR